MGGRHQPPRRPQQAAAIAVKRGPRRLKVCLIRRRQSRDWGIPKGAIEPGDTPRETALTEAWEEAGLEGRIVGRALGTYTYSKLGRPLRVAVFVMDVTRQTRSWDEKGFRARKWVSPRKAAALLAAHPALPLLERALARLDAREA